MNPASSSARGSVPTGTDLAPRGQITPGDKRKDRLFSLRSIFLSLLKEPLPLFFTGHSPKRISCIRYRVFSYISEKEWLQ